MYELVADSPCTSAGPSVMARFQTGPTAPLPTTLGTLAIGPPTRRYLTVESPASSSGSCGPSFDAVTHTVSVALSPEAAPWAGVLQYSMSVNGTPWRWRSFRGSNYRPVTGMPDLYLPCGSVDGGTLNSIPLLTAGMHTVSVTAFIPGSTARFTLTGQVELRCPGSPTDAGTPTDGSTPSDAGGCSVRAAVAGERTSRGLAGLLVALGLVGMGRRRRSGGSGNGPYMRMGGHSWPMGGSGLQ